MNTQLDLFEIEIPMPHRFEPGNCGYGRETAKLISGMLRGASQDRHAVAAEVSRLSGRDVSINMLNAYASPARVDHALPFWMGPVIEDVCESHALTDWLVARRGGRVAYGMDALKNELGKLVSLKRQANRDLNLKIQHLEQLLGDER